MSATHNVAGEIKEGLRAASSPRRERIDEQLPQDPGGEGGEGVHTDVGLLELAADPVLDPEDAASLATDEQVADERKIPEGRVQRVGWHDVAADVDAAAA